MAEPSTDIATADKSASLPAVLGSYKIASIAPAQLSKLIEANVAGGISAFDLSRIKVPAGGGITWVSPTLEGEEHVKEIEGVIVAWSDQRAYWKGEYSGAGTPPDCSSRDAKTGIGDPGGNCRACPFAQFGSAPMKNGKASRGQACKQVRLLFVVRPGDMLPVVISVPPTSLGSLKDYFLGKLANAGLTYYSVITRFTLASDKNADGIGYSKVEPKFVKQLSDAEADRIEGYSKAMQGVLATIDVDADTVATSS